MAPFRIISFDSGGVRGALSARILKRLAAKFPNLIARTHLFAGTSTGSLIALGLAYNKPAEDIDNLFCYDNMKKVFSPAHVNVFRPKFDNTELTRLLLTVFPEDLTLSSLKKYVFVPAFYVGSEEADAWTPVFFNNLPFSQSSESTAISVALSSSAAPTYFPSHNNHIDGGVMLTSPAAAPIIYAKNAFQDQYTFSDFRLLSIGTGKNPLCISQNTARWGLLHWGINLFHEIKLPLIEILLNDTTSLEVFYAKQLIKHNFFRINPKLDTLLELDDYKKIPLLKEIADQINLDDAYAFIDKYFLN